MSLSKNSTHSLRFVHSNDGSYDDGGDGRGADYVMGRSLMNEKRKQTNGK